MLRQSRGIVLRGAIQEDCLGYARDLSTTFVEARERPRPACGHSRRSRPVVVSEDERRMVPRPPDYSGGYVQCECGSHQRSAGEV